MRYCTTHRTLVDDGSAWCLAGELDWFIHGDRGVSGDPLPDDCNLTDPGDILAVLAEAGVLEVESIVRGAFTIPALPHSGHRYVSPWKESE